MTPEQIEEWRKSLTAVLPPATTDVDELCDLALDGLRFRKWVEAIEHNPTKLALLLTLLLDRGYTPAQYREAIDKFVVERAA